MVEEIPQELVKFWYLRAVLRSYRKMQSLARAINAVAKTCPAGIQKSVLEMHDRTRAEIDRLGRLYRGIVERLRIWKWFERITGVGPFIAGYLLSEANIPALVTAGQLWAYMGLEPPRPGKPKRRFKREGKFIVCTKLINSFFLAHDYSEEGAFYLRLYNDFLLEERRKNASGHFAALAREVAARIKNKFSPALQVLRGGCLTDSHLIARVRLRIARIFLAHFFEVCCWDLYQSDPPVPFDKARIGGRTYPVPFFTKESYLELPGVSLSDFYLTEPSTKG